MSEPYVSNERAELLSLRVRVHEVEELVGHYERTTVDLFNYIRNVDGLPDWDEWKEIRLQIAEVIENYGPDRSDGRSESALRPA